MKSFTPISGLSLWPQQSCLITELAEELSLWSNEELKQIVLVVPTQRLALHILQRLALQRKAFVPPKILNFEKFVSEFSQKDQNKT